MLTTKVKSEAIEVGRTRSLICVFLRPETRRERHADDENNLEKLPWTIVIMQAHGTRCSCHGLWLHGPRQAPLSAGCPKVPESVDAKRVCRPHRLKESFCQVLNPGFKYNTLTIRDYSACLSVIGNPSRVYA